MGLAMCSKFQRSSGLAQGGSMPNVCFFWKLKKNEIGAALALYEIEGMEAEEIAKRAMKIAADKCVFTNSNFVMKKITWE
jgi:hypothetical protein